MGGGRVWGVAGEGQEAGDGTVGVDAAAVAAGAWGSGGVEGEVGEVCGMAGMAAENVAADEDAEADGFTEVDAEKVIAAGAEPAFGKGQGGGAVFETDGEVEAGFEDGADGNIVPAGQGGRAADAAFLGAQAARERDAHADQGARGGGVLGAMDKVDGAGEEGGGIIVGGNGEEFFGEDFGGEIGGQAADGGGRDFDADKTVAGGVKGEPHGFAAGLGGEGAFFADEMAEEKLAGGVGDGAPGEAGELLKIGA